MEQPRWEEYMLYELTYLSDEKIHKRNEIIEEAAKSMKLTDALKSAVINSGMPIYINRGGWALSYLKQSGLIESPKRGEYKISVEGKRIIDSKPKSFGESDLEKYPSYQDFKSRIKSNTNKTDKNENDDGLTPEEKLDQAQEIIMKNVCSELLDQVRKMKPSAFEHLVVELLVAMGYGDKNDRNSSFKVTGRSGDGGIDGIIKQDKLGIEKIYVQAKRYGENNHVTPHEVRDFCGALMAKEGVNKKGIFITSSDFTKEGSYYVKNIDKSYNVILINGNDLAKYMYIYGIGVTTNRVITINKVDNDYFEDE